MTTNQLNSKTAEHAKPKEIDGVFKDKRYPDGGGLYLLVTAKGGKLWRVRFTSKLFGDETSNEIDEIQNLATVMMNVAKGNVSVIERTFIKQENGELKEKVRHIKPIRPDPRAGAFYLELSEKLATMVDIGEFETDAELEERYKGYYEKLKKQREEFANRVIE